MDGQAEFVDIFGQTLSDHDAVYDSLSRPALTCFASPVRVCHALLSAMQQWVLSPMRATWIELFLAMLAKASDASISRSLLLETVQ